MIASVIARARRRRRFLFLIIVLGGTLLAVALAGLAFGMVLTWTP